jgi:hypothetical protein
MKNHSHHPKPSDVAAANNNSPPEKLLIPRSQRRRFFLLFTCMTVMGWVVGGVVSIAVERILTRHLSAVDSFSWVSLLSNIAFAVIFAADQALVLRRYFPGRLWMIATSIGWLTANGVAAAWIDYISSTANSLNQPLSPGLAVILGFLSTVSYILSGVWLGLLQWLVLRRYTIKVWWWIFVPSIAFFLISLLTWLLSFIQFLIPETIRTATLYVSQQTFTAVILGIVPALGLSILKRRIPQRQPTIKQTHPQQR